MTMTGKKWPRYFAVLVAVIMIVETIAFTLTSYAKNDTNTTYELTNEDKSTISEISNMTGVKADEIIMLRKEGKSWNQILELIKNNPGYKAEGDVEKRNGILVKTGMDEAVISKLIEEGFTEEEITEAKSLMERVLFQLDEIANTQIITTSAPDTMSNTADNKEAEITEYKDLAGKIDLNEAVCLILKLSDELGGMQAVLDEYLCALQLGIDLNQCLADKEGYQKQKQQRLSELGTQDIITAARIEEKMLEMLQNMNNKNDDGMPEIKATVPSISGAAIDSPLPDVEAPDAQNIKPQNPAEVIMQEIEIMKSVGTEQDGR